jgi:hypothetical protein
MRASIVVAIVVLIRLAASANATPRGWTLPLGPEWEDHTEEALKDPGVAREIQSLQDQGAIVETTTYTTQTDMFLIVRLTDLPNIPAAIDVLEGAERRMRSSTAGSEKLYREERTALTLGSVTHVQSPKTMLVLRRIVGFREVGGLRRLEIGCGPDPAICDPLLASASLDTSGFRRLADLDARPNEGWLRILFVTACGVVGLLLVAAYGIMKRRRA